MRARQRGLIGLVCLVGTTVGLAQELNWVVVPFFRIRRYGHAIA